MLHFDLHVYPLCKYITISWYVDANYLFLALFCYLWCSKFTIQESNDKATETFGVFPSFCIPREGLWFGLWYDVRWRAVGVTDQENLLKCEVPFCDASCFMSHVLCCGNVQRYNTCHKPLGHFWKIMKNYSFLSISTITPWCTPFPLKQC